MLAVSSSVQDVAAWLGAPVVVFVLSLGVGLLIDRLAGLRAPNALLAPLGFCASIVLVMAAYRTGAGSWLALTVLVIAAAAGLALSRSELRMRANPGVLGLAGVGVYLLYVLPTALSGGWTWTGYNFLNDTAVHFVLADYVRHHGLLHDYLAQPESITRTVIKTYFDSGYPLGSHAYLATIAAALRVPIEVAYQSYLAAMAGLAAMAFAVLARRTQLAASVAAAVGAAAMASNLAFSYALQGSIKEIAMLATFAIAAACGRELLSGARPVGWAIATGICLAAGVAVYSAAALPLAGALVIALLVAAFVHRDAPLRRRIVPSLAGGGLAAVIASLPTLGQLGTFHRVAEGTLTGATSVASMLGNLARPLELVQMSGVWIAGNYTLPIEASARDALTHVLGWAVVGLVALGSVLLVRRRESGPLLYLAPVLVSLAALAARLTPYADAKLFAIASPGLVLAAGVTLAAAARPWRAIAVPVAALLAGAILWSDALAYHDVKLAPPRRVEALGHAARQYKGPGLVMVNEFEEFAKYFGRNSRVNVPDDSLSPRLADLRNRKRGIFGNYYDLDLQRLGYVEGFPYIVMRRSPAASRPPANFVLAYRSRYYEGWRRTARPRVVRHLPLQLLDSAALNARCSDVRDLARHAARGEWLVGAVHPETAGFDILTTSERSVGWTQHPTVGGAVLAKTPGHVGGAIPLSGGRYTIWVRGDFARQATLSIDGRPAGTVQGINTPGQWFSGRTLTLRRGVHQLRIVRPGGSLAPGDGASAVIGPLAVERDAPGRLRWVRPQRWRSLCGRLLDWIEVAER